MALVPGLGPRLTAAVLAHFGSAAAVRRASIAELRAVPLIGEKLAVSFVRSLQTVNVEAELRLLEKHDVRVFPLGDEGYPERLTTIPDPPPLLYMRGDILPEDANAIGIVGSRSCTPYGLRMAERLGAGFARLGWTVISGLARGIDGAAHRGALAAGGRTLAVLAGGLSRIYPPEHADLAREVAARGCLMTETPLTVAPQPGMFPARNRIISGLARGVIVVEAGERSGALITVEHAAEQGREVFAVPGPVDSAASAGCLELLRKGAKLVRSAEDVLEDLQGIAPPDPPPERTRTTKASRRESPPARETLFPEPAPPPAMDPRQQALWDALEEPRHGDELARMLGCSVAELTPLILTMELKRWVRRLPGNQYVRR